MSKSNKTTPNVPTLRFGRFYKNWFYGNLKQLLHIKNGKNQKPFECTNATVPVYGTGGVIGYVDRPIYHKDSIGIGRKGTIDKPVILKHPFWTVDTLFYSELAENTDLYFVYTLMQTIRWRSFDQSTGVPSLTSTVIENVAISYPELDEQKYIGNFLKLIDERIKIQNKIIEDLKVLKKELCNKVFNKGSFIKLGNFIDEVTARNKSNICDNVLSVSNKMGFIKQSEQFEDRIIASEDKHNYKVVTEGCFAYNPARINVGSIALLSTYKVGIISPMYVCFKTRNELDAEYLNFYYQSGYFYKELQKKLEGSVRQCLTYKNMSEILIPYVDVEKQKEIANIFKGFITLIATEEKYLKELQKQRSCFLNAMFI